ncbi:MAG: ABC transporter permease [Thermoprotei archaeon]|nr:MAG: ABC transporter permease [Thermoprotei archaeon]
MNASFILDAIRLALRGLSERRLRSALTIMGIAIGPLALVMMTSVVEGYSSYIVEQIESLGQNIILVEPISGYRLTERDLNLIRSIYGVKKAEPIYITSATIKIGSEEKQVSVWATDINLVLESMSGIKLIEGYIPSSTEIVKAVIGHDIAYDDGRQVYSVGDAISFIYYRPRSNGGVEERRATVLVSGVLDKFGGAFFLSPDTAIFLNTEAGQRLLGLHEWSGIIILAESTDLVRYIVNEIEDLFGDTVNVISLLGIAKIAQSITGAISFVTFSTSLSAFAVAIAGVAATMVTSVIERTREIGVMKALGFTNEQILVMILMESIMMSIIGGSIGIMLGIIGAHALASKGFMIRGELTTVVMYVPPKITTTLIIRTILITIAVGIAGGIFPAYQAAKIPPAVALRYE